MAIAKRPVNEKIPIMGSSRRANASNTPERKPGCPIPLQTGCLQGLPLPTSLDDGVKLLCSSAQCPYRDQFVHMECFRALEENLVKIMSNIGSARGWTDAQRRANLWDKKGLTLIQKRCRCPCGLGLARLDETAVFQARRNTALTTNPKPKKGKNKNLPKLNFGSGSGAVSSTIYSDKHYAKHENKRNRGHLRAISPSGSSISAESSTFNGDHTYERQNATYASWLGKCETESRPSLGTKNDSVSGWIQLSEFPTPVFDKRSSTSVPSAFSSKKVDGTVSYAAATLSKPVNEEQEAQKVTGSTEQGTRSRMPSVGLLIDGVEPKQIFNITNGLTTSSFASPSLLVGPVFDCCSIQSSICSDDSADVKITRSYIVANGYCAEDVDVSTILPTPPETPSSCASSTEGETRREDVTELGRYDLFCGRSFHLGELIIAQTYLPGII